MKEEHSPRPGVRSVLGLGAVILVLLGGGAWWSSYRDLTVAREREAVLEQRIEETQRHIDELQRRIERLRDDPATLERLAREELGLVRPGDVVIVLPDERVSKRQ